MPIPTFDPNTQFPPLSVLKLSASPFRASVETVLPGIVQIIDGLQTVGEAWTETALRLLPSLEATEEQKSFLSAQIDQAKKGLDPLPVPGTEESSTGPVDFMTWLKWGALGWGLYKLVR